MSLTELDIKPTYETLKEDPLNDFYIPVLSEAVSYKRIAGFFSSSSLAIAARGIGQLIRNGGRMQILACPILSSSDIEAVRESLENPAAVAQIIESSLLDSLDDFEDEFARNHVQALGWMLANGFLEIRIAVISSVADDDDSISDQLFHQKIGIVEDAEGNRVSFSGSINETASGWLSNSEEFKVFKSWEPGPYLPSDEEKFEEFWEGRREYARILPLSEAVSRKLIQEGENFKSDDIDYQAYREKKKAQSDIPLFSYQEKAVQAWFDNGCQLLFEMATGSGKTRTAIAATKRLLDKCNQLVVIVATPQSTLSRQWSKEFPTWVHFDQSLFLDGSAGKNKWADLGESFLKIRAGFYNSAVIYTTHASACKQKFVDTVESNHGNVPILFIGDEAHGLGSGKQMNALSDAYQYRIGLSATPSRWYDDLGSAVIEVYFGSKKFEFSIADALRTVNPLTGETFLTPYKYVPVFVAPDSEELREYWKKTLSISRSSYLAEGSVEEQEFLQKMIFDRADILKSAAGKVSALSRILRENEPIKDTLIFTSAAQIDETMRALNAKGVIAHRFTESQGTVPSPKYDGLCEREYIINQFKEGNYQALVALKCLDEGIDIPSADTAIIMSSSTNPREYIQRIGRVIRRYPGKKYAVIYDFVVLPSSKGIDDERIINMERKIMSKEFARMEDVAKNASNYSKIIAIITEKWEEFENGIQ